MNIQIPIIDIFAGPGGLGEGFSSAKSGNDEHIFKIKLSIEKDPLAHKTLELRAFYRQFADNAKPAEYYQYLKGKLDRDALFRQYPDQALNAKNEAWQATLGETNNDEIDSRIVTALNGAKNWVLIGGPPCQAYSLIGRVKIQGEDKKKAVAERTYETDKRHLLYKEYLRILAVHQPPVFVMENVKGLLTAEIGQQKTFDLILHDLQNPKTAIDGVPESSLSYILFSISKKHLGKTNPRDYIVRSEDYGIPQARHRIIIFGIRSDMYLSPPVPLQKAEKQVFIEQVIGDLPKLRSGISKKGDSPENWKKAIQANTNAQWLNILDDEKRKEIIQEINRIGEIGSELSRGASYIPTNIIPEQHADWYVDDALGGVCNHETRTHIPEDLHRYLFAAIFGREFGRAPKLQDFPDNLLPNHANAHEETDQLKFGDRFKVQIKGKPSTTVVSHISKDGHYYIHYDPSQCRSLTVREAARLQTFPDNYFFEGPRTEQYHQVGNAVPPLLAREIAKIVADVLGKLDQKLL